MSHVGSVHTVRTSTSRTGSHIPLGAAEEASGFARTSAGNSGVLADVTDLAQPTYACEPAAPAATAARAITSTLAGSPHRGYLCHIDHHARQLHARQHHSPGPLKNVHFWRNAYYYYEEVSVGVGADEGAIDVIQEFLVSSSGRIDGLDSSPPEHVVAGGRGLSAAAQ